MNFPDREHLYHITFTAFSYSVLLFYTTADSTVGTAQRIVNNVAPYCDLCMIRCSHLHEPKTADLLPVVNLLKRVG